MPDNDNKFDQQLRDLLHDHASPVRGDLWRRIHTGIDTPLRLRPWRSLRSLRYVGAGAATLIAVLAAAHYLYVRDVHRSTPTANHYVNIKPANTTGKASATPQNTANLTTPSLSVAPQSVASRPAATQSVTSQPVAPQPMTSPASSKAANTKAGNTPLIGTPANVNYGEFATISSATTPPGTHQSVLPGATPPAPLRATHRPITLPAIARTAPATTPRTTLFTRIPRPKQSREPDPTSLSKTSHPIRLRSISVYGAPAIPNHSYTWSWSAGLRASVQLSERWSVTAGVQYSRANVPGMQIDRYDSLQPFHFNNWEFPVYAGYAAKMGRVNLTVNAGIIVKASTTYSTTNFHYGWPNPFGYGGYLGAHISRSLTNSFAVFAEPYARFSVTNYRMIIPSQRLSTGVAIGAKYQL